MKWPFVLAGAALTLVALVANEWVLGAWLTTMGRVSNPATRLALGVVDVLALAAGLTLLIRRERAPWRQMLLAVIATLFALALTEGGLRAWFAVRSRLQPPDRRIAERIGWRPLADVTSEHDLPAFGRVRYSTTRGGFRVFGDPRATKPKILFIGDSYTEAPMVSDGEVYYHRLARARPDLEVFAIGGRGFGTLQEYMLLDEWVDEIRPDLVILQLHPNDIVNNSHALESRSTSDNNQMTRPYWEQGAVVMRFPENDAWGPLYNLARHSYLLRLINVNLTFLRARRVGSVEQAATRDDPDVVRATETTVEILAMFRRRAGVPVSAFSARPDTWMRMWTASEVCSRAGIRFIPGVGEAVDAATAAGEKVTGLPVDAHWNGAGHAIAARVLEEWIAREMR